jgi:uncharacterized protein
MKEPFLTGLTIFYSLLVEAMPFLLLGVLLSGVMLLFVDEKKLLKNLPTNPMLAALVGSAVGLALPVCECGNIPVARRFLLQGLPMPMVIGFLFAAPTLNPIVFWATWVAFRDQPEMVFLRIGCTLLISVAIACLFSTQKDLEPLLQPGIAAMVQRQKVGSLLLQPQIGFLERSKNKVVVGSPKRSWKSRLELLAINSLQELRELGGVLVLGSAIAAAVQVLVPREWILGLAHNPIAAIAAMLLLAVVVSICSTVDAFFALSFSSVLGSGAILAFLVLGPMIDLKSTGLLLTIFQWRSVLYLLLLAVLMTFCCALGANYVFG